MRKLSTIAKIVFEILTDLPETRNNDYVLWLEAIKRMEPAFNTDMSVENFLRFVNEFDIPPFGSVSRARRKVQEQHPELRGTEKVQAMRSDLEFDFEEFARDHIC